MPLSALDFHITIKSTSLSPGNVEKTQRESLVSKIASNCYRCTLCNIEVTGLDVMETHLIGSKHNKKLKLSQGGRAPPPPARVEVNSCGRGDQKQTQETPLAATVHGLFRSDWTINFKMLTTD